jgi:hypothetical protein
MSSKNNITIRELSRKVLTLHSPEEVFLLEFYQGNTKAGGATSNGPLGIGFESVAVLLLPVVWKIFEDIIDEAKKEIIKSGTKDGITSLKELLKNRRKAIVLDDALPALLLEDIRLQLIELGIDSKQHSNLAETMSLVLVDTFATAVI